MKPILLICAGLMSAGTVVAAKAPAAPQPVTVLVLGPRFRQTHERAEILLGHRDGSYPPPDPRANLFPSPADVIPPVETSKTPAEPEPVGSDETLLTEALVALKKGRGGTAETGGVAYLSVGERLYREGDLISVPLRTGTIELRLIRISGKTATLRLNQAQADLRF